MRWQRVWDCVGVDGRRSSQKSAQHDRLRFRVRGGTRQHSATHQWGGNLAWRRKALSNKLINNLVIGKLSEDLLCMGEPE